MATYPTEYTKRSLHFPLDQNLFAFSLATSKVLDILITTDPISVGWCHQDGRGAGGGNDMQGNFRHIRKI